MRYRSLLSAAFCFLVAVCSLQYVPVSFDVVFEDSPSTPTRRDGQQLRRPPVVVVVAFVFGV